MIKDNFTVSNLLLSKDVRVCNDTEMWTITVPSVKEYVSEPIQSFLNLFDDNSVLKKVFPKMADANNLELLNFLIFQLGAYIEFKRLHASVLQALTMLFTDWKMENRELIIQDKRLTNEILEYFLYIIQASAGKKVTPPQTFETEEQRQAWLHQQELEKKIAKLKEKNSIGDSEGLAKVFLVLQHKLRVSMEWCQNQPMIVLNWFYVNAMEIYSYEASMSAYTNGMLKKKPKFFLKK